MTRVLTVLLFSFFCLDLIAATIPERREFPLNEKINPCENFHAYVCSKVEEGFQLRDDRSHHMFSFNDSSERLLEIKKSHLKNLPQKTGLTPRTKQIRDYYLACMNEKSSIAAEQKEVKKVLADLVKVSTTAQLLSYTYKKMPEAVANFIYLGVAANLDDPKKLDVLAGVNLMRLPDHKYYENPALMIDYENLLSAFYKTIYGPELSAADADKKAQKIIALQKEFIKTYPVAAIRRQRWSERRVSSAIDFIKAYPQLQLETLLSPLPKNLLINTPVPEGLAFLNTHLDKYPTEVWKDFYLLTNLNDLLDDAYSSYFQQKFEFNRKYFGGPEKRPDRQERCTTTASRTFVKELDADLIETVFPKFDDKKFELMVQAIRASILVGLEKNTWLSKEAKTDAIAKIKNARLQLVRPGNDREWDFNVLRTYSARDPIANLHKYQRANWEKFLKELSEPNNQDAWGMGPLTVNAYYNQSENKFVIPIGILQYPFYDQNNLEIENIGAIGAVIGHELGHSVDDKGSKYNFEGKLTNWMPMKDLAQFNERSRQLVSYFDKAGFDGKLTLGENVADLVGLTFAYDTAFPGGLAKKEEQQKFFVAYARTWCAVTRPELAKLRLKTDPHAAGWARINEQVKHQPAFAEAFSCKPGDKMTLPEKDRVKIW